MKKVLKIIILVIILLIIVLLLIYYLFIFIPFPTLPCRTYIEMDNTYAEQNAFYSLVDNYTSFRSASNYFSADEIVDLPYPERVGSSRVFKIYFHESAISHYKSGNILLRYNNHFFYSVIPAVFENDVYGYVFKFYVADNSTDEDIYLPDALEEVDSWPTVRNLKKSQFITVIDGIATLEDIKRIDPATNFCDYTNGTASSYHRFLDGSIMFINYKQKGNKWVVSFHKVYKDLANFTDILLPIDLKLIK